MSLTLQFTSKRFSFEHSFTAHQLVVGVVLVFGLMTISSRSAKQPEESVVRVQHVQSGLESHQREVQALRDSTEQQLAGVMLKLGEIEGQVQRVNALGARLVEEQGIDPKEFSFDEIPAYGGPVLDDTITITGQNELLSNIDHVLNQLNDKSQQLQALESILLNHHINGERELTGRPIKSGWLSSYYGVRKDPFSGKPAMHKGLDFAGKEGEPVVATGAGLVTWSGERYGYGNLVEIDHGDGLVTRYGHNKSLSVKIGDVVTKGQEIALMGSTGRSTGAHVHYEVLKRGKQQDPLPYVYRKK